MADLSPLLGEERKSDFGAVSSVGTHKRHSVVAGETLFPQWFNFWESYHC